MDSMRSSFRLLPILLGIAVSPLSSQAINIQIDYQFDDNNFFDLSTADGIAARASLQAAADRFSAIITSNLDAHVPSMESPPPTWRVGFTHPATGASTDLSVAANATADPLALAGAGDADIYDPTFTLPQDTWVLFAGGRSLTSAGVGGTGTGTNFSSVFMDASSHLRRNWRPGAFVGSTGGADQGDIPVWGGSISFDTDVADVTWHYDHTTLSTGGETDFYTIALHEIGHALGLSTSWNEFDDLISSSSYTGAKALAALNEDNGSAVTSISIVGGGNNHWADGGDQSFPFNDSASAPAVGTTVGVLQDLLLDPTANFTVAQRRFELTNVDVAALADIGWQVIPEPGLTSLLALSSFLLVGIRRRDQSPNRTR